MTAVEHHLPIVESTIPAAVPPADRVRCLSWRTEDDTRAFAAALAAALTAPPGCHSLGVELHGELGAGKTTLVRHLLQAMGVEGRIKSPTYAVVEPYTVTLPSAVGPTRPEASPEVSPVDATPGSPAAAWPVWHFDFYRFNDPAEWEDAGFRDIFASPGLKLVEWPEKAAGLLPPADLVLRIEVLDDTARAVQLLAQTPLGATLLKGLPA
ncbi:MAG: tRNA (adenosine(37)-N6)-threonylcarbamoyltransferase complex ATPase subunit type 1 TsaE [Burkholderiales bacterium]|nr:tRNA (adenosine(37)-N6)-threonylcarbamoyltransferase complex ATPase subunit type 1 TsaE [Burkholderiales bacterium]